MKRRLIATLAALVAAAGLSACGGGGGGVTGCAVPPGLLSEAVGKFADEYWACQSVEVPVVPIGFYFVKDGTGDSDVMGNLTWTGEYSATGSGSDTCASYDVKAKNAGYGTFTMTDVNLADGDDTLTFSMQGDFTIGPEEYNGLTMICVRTATGS